MRRAVGVGVAVLLVALAVWWRWSGGEREPDVEPAAVDTRSPAVRRAVTAMHEEKGLPAWFGQPGAPPRRVAGRVTLAGKPVAARVTLTSEATEAGVVAPEAVEAGADGAFDFGLQVAASYTVSAARDDAAPAIVPVDLRDPTRRPVPDELVLELQPCVHTVGGVVRDASGGVVAGARVRVERNRERGPHVTSDDQGAYLACVPRGRVSLLFSADGYGSMERELDATGHMTYDARLTPEGVVTGRVVSAADGAPIAGARVVIGLTSWSSNERALDAATVTDKAGQFRLAGLGAADMGVRAEAPGWVMQAGGRVVLAVRPAESIDDIVLHMVPASSIAGTVLRGDEPVAGVGIQWAPFGAGTRGSALTLADGSFSLDDVSPGIGGFEVNGYDVTEPDKLEATAERTEGVRVQVEAMASIAGRCVRGGAPVSGCSVSAWPRGGAGRSAMADADGHFELTGLKPATYRLSADSSAVGAFATNQEVTVDRGQRVDDIVLDLEFAATIAGMVVDQHGAALAGATVNVSLVGGEDYGEARSGVDGTFHIDKLSGGGSYAVTVRAPQSQARLEPAGAKAHRNVLVPGPDSHVTGIRLAVTTESDVIAGRVVTADGVPVADAHITAEVVTKGGRTHFSGWDELPRTTTAQNGTFELQLVGPATFALQAVSPAGATKEVSGIAMGTRDVLIELDPSGRIEGTIAGFSGPPRIEARSPSGKAVVTARGDGFSFDALPAGDYGIDATSGLEHVRAEATVVAGQTTRVHLESHGVGKIEVTARDVRTDAPLAGVFCNAQPWTEGEHFVSSSEDPSTDSAGRVVMRTPAGRVRLTCRGPGRYSMPIARVQVPTDGTVRVALGLFEPAPTTKDDTANFGFIATSTDDALTVSEVAAGGPAQGKLAVGDRIDVIDGIEVAAVTARAAKGLLVKPPGARLAMTVDRAGQRLDVSLESSTVTP